MPKAGGNSSPCTAQRNKEMNKYYSIGAFSVFCFTAKSVFEEFDMANMLWFLLIVVAPYVTKFSHCIYYEKTAT